MTGLCDNFINSNNQSADCRPPASAAKFVGC
jgi:hypothetical protein